MCRPLYSRPSDALRPSESEFMDAKGLSFYYVAVSRQETKVPTLIDLLLALQVSSGPLAVTICCSSRDTLELLVDALEPLKSARIHFLHSDLSDEEFTARIGALGKCLESVGAPEPEELAAVPDPVQPDLVHGVIYDQERTIDQNSAGGPAETSLGSAGEKVELSLLITTSVCFKRIARLPCQLLINYDLPLQQITVLSAQDRKHKADSKGKIVVFFFVAGMVDQFRQLEALVPGTTISVMPVKLNAILDQ